MSIEGLPTGWDWATSYELRIIVGGLVGQYPLGGVAWDYFHYLIGLAELGHEVVGVDVSQRALVAAAGLPESEIARPRV